MCTEQLSLMRSMKRWKNTSDTTRYHLADATFKERHSNDKRDFKNQKYCNCTELAKYVWELKGKTIAPIIKWKILSKVYGNRKQNMCILCLTEKLWIINFIHDHSYLNKKFELRNKCRDINKFLLQNVKRWIW